MKKRSTQLEDLEKGVGFTWGEVIEITHLREYAFASYHPWQQNGMESMVGIPNTSVVCWHIWINYKDTCRGAKSLEEAMATAVAYKLEGVNSQAADYFMKMLRED